MPAAKRKHWRPVLTLLFITPVLTELLSNNLSFSMLFLSPIAMPFFATIGYGFPVLLIRDFAVGRGYGLCQLAILGIAYGIWNEGVLAKTMLREYHLPIDLFDFYGIAYHIAVPWAFLISTWHAMHAVVYPILIVHFFFPSHRSEPWLGRASSIVIALITLFFGALIYFGHSPEAPTGTTPQLLIFIVVAVALGLIALLLPRTPTVVPGGSFQWTAIRHGFCLFLAAFFIPLLLARYQIPVFLYTTYFVVLIGALIYYFSGKKTLAEKPALLFMLGDQICLASFGLIGACGMHSYERIAASLMFLAIFLFSIGWLRKQKTETYLPIEKEEIDPTAITERK